MVAVRNLLIAGVVAVLVLGFLAACNPNQSLIWCHEGDEISSGTRSQISDYSLKFAGYVFDGKTDSVFDNLTDEARTGTSREQVSGILASLKPFSPFLYPRISRIMTVSIKGFAQANIADCTKDASHSENRVVVAIHGKQDQAYALVDSSSEQDLWRVVVWLTSGKGAWRVQGFHVSQVTAVGKPAMEVLKLARAESQLGHNLNAGVLYSAAGTIADHGPFYRTGIQDVIQQEAQKVAAPTEFLGNPPYLLKGEVGDPFKVLRISSFGAGGKLYMVVAQEVEQWKNSPDVEKKNQLLIRTFAKRFPEYASVFAGLIADANERGTNRIWRTVVDNADMHSVVR